MAEQPSPREMGCGVLVLGVVFVLFAITMLFVLDMPVHLSTPWPALTRWMVEKLGNRGINLLTSVLFGAGGCFAIAYGWCALSPRLDQ